MYGLLVTVSIDPAGSEEAAKALEEQVVPAVKASPGFVTGYWFDPRQAGSALEGYAIIVYDSEANAKQGEEMAKSSPRAPAVSFTNFEVREIIASA